MTPGIFRVVILVCSLVMSAFASAVVEGYKYPFEDPEDVKRFQQLAEELRCPKCQNQNLADSNAPVASDMRGKMYELMQDGQSNQEVVDYMVARYGDFVHYKPPVRGSTYLLWAGPAIVFVLGALLVVGIRRSKDRQIQPLSQQEQDRLKAIKQEGGSEH